MIVTRAWSSWSIGRPFNFQIKRLPLYLRRKQTRRENLQVNGQHVCVVSMLFLRCTFKGKLAKMNRHIMLRLTACYTCWSKCVYIKCSGPWMMSFFKDKYVVVVKICEISLSTQRNTTQRKENHNFDNAAIFFKPTNSPSGFSPRLKLICFFFCP